MAWRELFEVTGDREFECGYEAALQAALANDAEFLPADSDQQRVMDRLHAYAYFLEGLLPVLDRPECAAAFRRRRGPRVRVCCARSRLFSRAPMCTRNCCERGLLGTHWYCRSMKSGGRA